jgi:hypothetical protein
MINRCALAVCVLLCGSGCATTIVRSGRPPLDTPPGYEERWHSAFLWGAVAGGAPYDLAQICPNGWSQVTLARDPFTLLAGVVTLFIYSPGRVTIVCAVPGGPRLPPPEGYAPNALSMPTAPGTALQP